MALFANQRAAAPASPYLIEFKAGKCRFSTKPDSPDDMEITSVEGPGMIYLNQTDDMLTRFCYKNLTSKQVEDELIVFPGDAIFMNVDDNPESRVFLFKFKNSTTDRWHFYWMQETDAEKDAQLCTRLNQLMNGENRAPAASAAGSRAGGAAGGRMGGVEALQQMLGLPPGDTAQLFQSIPPAQLQQLLGSQIDGMGGLDPAALLSSLGGGATPRGAPAGNDDNMTTPVAQISGTPAVPPAAPGRGANARRHGGNTQGNAGGIQLSQLQSALSGVASTPAAPPENVAAMAEQLEKEKPSASEKKVEAEGEAAKEPTAKRTKPGDEDKDDDSEQPKTVEDGMDLD